MFLLEKTIFIAGYIKMTLAWKVIIATGIVVSLFVGMFTIDNRFAKSQDLILLETHMEDGVENKLLLAEAQTVKTFKTFQMQQIIMNKALQLQILQMQKDSIEKEYWTLKSELRKNRDDLELKQDFNDIKIQREKIKEKIDKKILEK
jgi:hypothetical protein